MINEKQASVPEAARSLSRHHCTRIAELFVSPKHRWKAFHSDELHEEQIGQTSPGLLGLTVLRLSASPHRVEEQETRE